MKKRLKDLRTALNLSQTDFASTLGIPFTAISKYERGEIKPSSDLLAKIGLYHNVNLNWLVTGNGYIFNGSNNENLYCNSLSSDESELLKDFNSLLAEDRDSVLKFTKLKKIESEINTLVEGFIKLEPCERKDVMLSIKKKLINKRK